MRKRQPLSKSLAIALAMLAVVGASDGNALDRSRVGAETHPLLINAHTDASLEVDRGQKVRIPLPVIRAAGTLEWRGRQFDLASIAVTAADETCGEGLNAWPCGRLALTAIRRFVRTKTIECVPLTGGTAAHRAHCSLAGQDIAAWLVTHGWARADGPAHGDLEEAAREAGLGIWSPFRPGITGVGTAVGARHGSSRTISGEGVADATVLVEVDLSGQRLTLIHKGRTVANWPVSTARTGKVTPTGQWRAQWLSRHHRSSLYNNASMPYAVFYDGHYAIHGTDAIGRLGSPASAGCVRLHPNHAAVVYDLASREGVENTVVVIRH